MKPLVTFSFITFIIHSEIHTEQFLYILFISFMLQFSYLYWKGWYNKYAVFLLLKQNLRWNIWENGSVQPPDTNEIQSHTRHPTPLALTIFLSFLLWSSPSPELCRSCIVGGPVEAGNLTTTYFLHFYKGGFSVMVSSVAFFLCCGVGTALTRNVDTYF